MILRLAIAALVACHPPPSSVTAVGKTPAPCLVYQPALPGDPVEQCSCDELPWDYCNRLRVAAAERSAQQWVRIFVWRSCSR